MHSRFLRPARLLLTTLAWLAVTANANAALTDDPGLDTTWKQVTDRNGIQV